jgi:monoamine oxidase
VGGGIAGLNAALTLRDAGYASTVYEASNRVGGRMHSDTTSWANGQVSEHCGELVDSDHKAIQKLASRFNISLTDLLSAEPIHSDETYYFFGTYYTRDPANIDFGPVYNAVHKDKNAASYPTLYNLSTPAGQVLDVAYNIEYGNVTSQQSSLNLIYLLSFQPIPGNFRIFGRSDERYHLTGGNERLPKAIAASLPAGSVKLNWAMTAIAANADGSFTLSFSTPTGPQSATFDRVIRALPFSVL